MPISVACLPSQLAAGRIAWRGEHQQQRDGEQGGRKEAGYELGLMNHSGPCIGRRWRSHSHLEAILSGLEPPLRGGADPDLEMPRKTTIGLGAFLLLYLSWQLFHWIPGGVTQIGDVFFPLIEVAAILACWRASRRCAEVNRLRWFWRLTALATAAQLVGDTTMAVYDFSGTEIPVPSLADLGYLSFYPLMLLALTRVPVAPTSHVQRVRLSLDLTIAMVGGAMVVWHLMVAPTLSEGGLGAAQMLTSIAYPIGDLVLLAGLGIVLLRWSPAALHRQLSLIAVGLAMFIAADLVYAYAVLHGGYSAGGWIDMLWIVAFAIFTLAAASQKRMRAGAPETIVPRREVFEQKVAWFPFAAIALGSVILLSSEQGEKLVELTLVLAAIGLAALIAIRQYVTQKEMIRLQLELREAHDQLAEMASRDALTSVANRRAIEATLVDEIERARRYRRDLSILFLDVDHFKSINDRFGHAVGDRVLADFASTVEGCLRPIDTLSRWGGEEFVVVLPETGADDATRAAERIRAGIEAHCFQLEGEERLTCSIGVASFPPDATDTAALIDVADQAMYEAKRLGRNRVVTTNRVAPDSNPPRQMDTACLIQA